MANLPVDPKIAKMIIYGTIFRFDLHSFSKVAFSLSVLAGRKELIISSLNGKVQGARTFFDLILSGRTEDF